jgi:hypothetical protein
MFAISVAIALGCGVSAYYAAQSASVSRERIEAQLIDDELRPIAARWNDSLGLLKELQGEPYAEADLGVLEAYLTKIRRDGVSKHTPMKQKIDAVANDNSEILALLSIYAPHARTSEFKLMSEKFRDYAIRFRDRWQSVLEIYMAGGSLPATNPALPGDLASGIQAEISAVRPER